MKPKKALSREQIIKVRLLYRRTHNGKRGHTQQELAKMFYVDASTISGYVRGKGK